MLSTDPRERRNLSRRDLLRAGAFAGIGAFIAACNPNRGTTTPSGPSGGAAPAATPASGGPKVGGTFVFAETIKIISLDPHRAQQAVERAILGEVYNGLLRYKAPPAAAPNAVIEGDLADRWKQVDDRTYEFNIVSGVKFHNVPPANGRELTADDAKFSIERVSSDKPAFPFRALFPVDTATAVDKLTLRVRLKEPFAPFLGFCAFPYFNVIPPELAKENNDDIVKVAVGTGPFVLKKFDPNVEAILERHPEYFRKGMPYLDGIRMTVLPDKTAAFNAFRAKQLDITPILVPSLITAEQAELLKKEMPEVTVHLVQGLPWQSIRFNAAKKPFDDKRVRQAFSLLTNRDELIAKYTSGKATLIGPLPSSMSAWALPDSTLKAHPLYKRDVAKAKQLFADAGVTLPWKVRYLTTISHKDLVALIAQQWSEAGIELDTTVTPDTGVFYSFAEKGDFDILSFGHSGFQDPDDYFSTYIASDGARNYGKYSNKEVDDLIVKQRQALDESARKKIVTDLQMKLLDESYFLYLVSTPMHVAAHPYVKNFWVNPIIFGATRYWESLWMDK